MIIAPMLASTSSQYATWGLIAATTASMFWAVSVVLYRRVGRVMPPVMLNMTKGLAAVAILSVILAVDRFVFGHQQWDLSAWMLVLMALSGVIGIGLGDSLFFAGLNRMGARRMLLLFTINPVITVLVAWVFMGEPLVAWQLVGVALTCGGVAWVIAERNSENSDGHVDTLGILFGLVAASCQATGVLMSRYVFEQGEMTAVSSAWLRLAAGSVVLILLLPIDKLLKDPGGQAHHHPAHPSKSNAAIMFTAALMLGTVGGIWLMQIAVKESDRVGIASTLLSTSPLFILPIVAMLGEHISKRAVFGAIISIAGIALLYLFSA
jgi:drug/metabolite transporter (DMT)-like permease